MDDTNSIFVETVATLTGIFVGSFAALVIDRRHERRRLQRRAKVVLSSLAHELNDNFRAIQKAKPAYVSTPWGKSFYIGTVSWETAVAGGDLPHIIGFELTNSISAQYALFMRIRYYVDLLTRLWFAPSDIPGHDAIQRGFNRRILDAMSQAKGQHSDVMGRIERALAEN